jgi:hypothetical protein
MRHGSDRKPGQALRSAAALNERDNAIAWRSPAATAELNNFRLPGHDRNPQVIALLAVGVVVQSEKLLRRI